MKARFGPFTLDTGRQQVLDGGRVVPLSPKAFGVLALLLERRPDVVDKETIVTRVWFGAHVSDASLTMVVAEIRKALGDSAESPRYIRTAHRRGYAFCAEADTLDPEATAAAPRFWLVIGGERTVIGAGETIVGRDPSSGVWLDVPSVSWRHARFLLDGGKATLEDLGSTNGTFVRGGRIRSAVRLSHGDALAFGEIQATFGASAEAPVSRTERLPRK